MNSPIYKLPILLIAVLVFTLFGSARQLQAQISYQLSPAPDVWYNSVDGLRLGVRLKGHQGGTFRNGPHRLNAGVWLATRFPDNPVSYYISFTEPVPSISDFGSEANIRIESSFRTGFQQHGLSFNKRWQKGFNEQNYKEVSLGFSAEQRFEEGYVLYPQLWQKEWLYLATLDLVATNKNTPGRYLLSLSADAQLGPSYGPFIRSDISFQQKIRFSSSFMVYGRLYSGFASKQTAPEYLFLHSHKSARRWMEKGLTRARGTIPPNWMESGIIQVGGGSNLRGYLEQDIKQLNNGNAPLYTSLSALNVELDYPNPLDKAIGDIPVLGEFIDFRSYLFFDAGTSMGFTKVEESRFLSDAGMGFLFSLNIPDYLGKARGLRIRYDLPIWLSNPEAEKSLKIRHLVGIGAIITL